MAQADGRQASFVPTLGAALRRDGGLYLAIALYTLAGLAFVMAAGAWDRLAYSRYVVQWTVLFALFMPAVALVFDAVMLVHRFDRRRRLAARRIFSARRFAHMAGGIALLTGLMVFQGTFTSVKNALPVWHGGFPYDRLHADIDRWLHFGVDPWRPLMALAGRDWLREAVQWNYNVGWLVLTFATLFFVATSPRAAALRGRYVLCFMLVWVVVGNLLAGLFLSAGPAFYGLVTGDAARFGEQLAFLARSDSAANAAVVLQDYLWRLHESGRAGFGSGISAFPSVHVALTALNTFFAFEVSRRLGLIMCAYLAVIAASSVYLAWHYAIDAYVAVPLVAAIYLAVRRAAAPAGRRTAPGALPAPALRAT